MKAAFPFLIVDYGHGGIHEAVYPTPGKRYTFERDDRIIQVYEGVQNRIIAAGLIRRALAAGIRVYDCVSNRWWTTPPRWQDLEQKDVSLSTRVRNANLRRKGLLISLHSNATGTTHQGQGTTATGWELYTSRGVTRSDAAANHFADMLRGASEPVRGVFDKGFAMVTNTRGSAILVEHGFHTTWADAQRIIEQPDEISAIYWTCLQGLFK